MTEGDENGELARGEGFAAIRCDGQRKNVIFAISNVDQK